MRLTKRHAANMRSSRATLLLAGATILASTQISSLRASSDDDSQYYFVPQQQTSWLPSRYSPGGWNGYRGGYKLSGRTSITRPEYSVQQPLGSRQGGYGGGGYGGGGYGGGGYGGGGYGGGGYGGGYGLGGFGWQAGYGRQQNYGAVGTPAYGFYGGLLAPYLDGDFSYAYPQIPYTEGDPYHLSGYVLQLPKPTTTESPTTTITSNTTNPPTVSSTGGGPPALTVGPGSGPKVPTSGVPGGREVSDVNANEGSAASSASGTSQAQAPELKADANTRAIVNPEATRPGAGFGSGGGFIRTGAQPGGQPTPGLEKTKETVKNNGAVVETVDSGDTQFAKLSQQAEAEQGAKIPASMTAENAQMRGRLGEIDRRQFARQLQLQPHQQGFNGFNMPQQGFNPNFNGQQQFNPQFRQQQQFNPNAFQQPQQPQQQFLQQPGEAQQQPIKSGNVQGLGDEGQSPMTAEQQKQSQKQLTFGGNGQFFPGSNNLLAGIGGPPVEGTFNRIRQQGSAMKDAQRKQKEQEQQQQLQQPQQFAGQGFNPQFNAGFNGQQFPQQQQQFPQQQQFGGMNPQFLAGGAPGGSGGFGAGSLGQPQSFGGFGRPGPQFGGGGLSPMMGGGGGFGQMPQGNFGRR